MKQKKVILELYMEIWYCYQDGKSMAYPLFTTTTYEDADNICKKRNYDVIQVIDLELQDFDDTPDHKTWWKGLNEEEQTKLCQKHFQGIPVDSLMERSIKVMFSIFHHSHSDIGQRAHHFDFLISKSHLFTQTTNEKCIN